MPRKKNEDILKEKLAEQSTAHLAELLCIADKVFDTTSDHEVDAAWMVRGIIDSVRVKRGIEPPGEPSGSFARIAYLAGCSAYRDMLNTKDIMRKVEER